MSKTREDAFLGGRLSIRQPVDGYRAGADPVFLAAAVPARPGDSVLELGCGVGTALLCLMERVADLSVVGVERNAQYAELARSNCTSNDHLAKIVTADIADLPAELMQRSFDHVMFNPPFFDRDQGNHSPNAGREAGRGATRETSHWYDAALKRLKPGGVLTVINRMEGLPNTLAAIEDRVGAVCVLPLQPRTSRPAKLFIMKAKKGSKTPFSLLPSLVLHRGETHVKDGDDYTKAASKILRSGEALAMRN